MRPLLSIVIPCYNEEKNIPLLFKKFAGFALENSMEIIFVNNGSSDKTEEILAGLLPKHPFAKTVHVIKNRGYGFGILSGLKKATGQYIGWTHADLQTDPGDTLRALEIIKKNFGREIFIKGSRKKRPIADNLFSVGMSLLESAYFKTPLFEINAQPTIFPRSFFETWSNPPEDFSLDLFAYLTAKKSGIDVVRFPVLFPKRIHGQSSWNRSFKDRIKLIKRTLSYSRLLKKRIGNNANNSGMMFIAHRVNTIEELKKIPTYYGVEIDLRDKGNRLILQHEPFGDGEDFESWLKHYKHRHLLLNIKSERIEHRVLELIRKYNIASYFFLDCSFPMINTLNKLGERNIALRFSEFEPLESVLSMKDFVRWVWIDCFTKFPVTREAYEMLKDSKLKTCLVSPELQGKPEEIESYAKYIKENQMVFDAVCTKSYNIEKWR